VIALTQKGLSQGEIARHVGVSLSTVQRWLTQGTFPERRPRHQASQLDHYQSLIDRRWREGCHNVAWIYRELCAQEGYRGSYGALYAYVSRKLGGHPVRKGWLVPLRCKRLFLHGNPPGCLFVGTKT
jgi:transposase